MSGRTRRGLVTLCIGLGLIGVGLALRALSPEPGQDVGIELYSSKLIGGVVSFVGFVWSIAGLARTLGAIGASRLPPPLGRRGVEVPEGAGETGKVIGDVAHGVRWSVLVVGLLAMALAGGIWMSAKQGEPLLALLWVLIALPLGGVGLVLTLLGCVGLAAGAGAKRRAMKKADRDG